MKLRILRVSAVALALSGCATQPEITLLVGPRRQNNGAHDTAATIMLIQKVGKHAVTGCVHQSEPKHGRPFNDEPEETDDTCGLGGRWGGNARR